MWWHEAETTSAADAHYTHPTKDGELQPPGFLCLSMLSCSKLFIRALSYLASFDFHRFSFEKNCIVLFARFSKIPAIKACYQNRNFFFFFLHQLFTTLLYLLDSSFVTSVSTKFTVALGASPTCAKSTSAPYQFTAFTTCIHVTEEHLDTITIIKGAGFILSAGLDSDFTTFLKSEAQVNTSCPIYNQHTFNISKT